MTLNVMFERFSTDARRILVEAQGHAARTGADHIGTSHVLLGLLDVQPDLVGLVVPVSAAEVRQALEPGMHGEGRTAGDVAGDKATGGTAVPFSPPAKLALERSLRAALRLEHNSIEAGHLLLGLLATESSAAAQVLGELGADATRVGALEVEVARRGPARLRTGEIGTFAPRRWTSGAQTALVIGKRLSEQAGVLSTEHLLRALLREGKGLAARALDHLGVTEESLEEALGDLDAATTSDAPPMPSEVVVKLGDVEGRFLIPAGAPPEEAAKRLKEAIASGRLEAVLRAALERDPGAPPA